MRAKPYDTGSASRRILRTTLAQAYTRQQTAVGQIFHIGWALGLNNVRASA